MRQAGTFVAVVVATCSLTGTALAVTPKKSHMFEGTTAQVRLANHTITLQTGSKGKVVHARIHWRAPCDSGNFWTETTQISKDGIVNEGGGVFHSDVAYTGNAGGGIKGKISGALEGSFPDRSHAEGSWKAKVKVFNGKQQIDTCRMGTTWTAVG
jgi:hypothetical protein